MHILAIDTATTSCSAAILKERVVLAEVTVNSGETHSRHLMDLVRTVTDRAGLTLSDVDGFAVTQGPGTFTGLRIGAAAVKGLALALDRPVAGVSSLEALAWQAAGTTGGNICALLDARKSEVYYSQYRSVDGRLAPQGTEQVAAIETVLASLDKVPVLFVGSGALLYKALILERLGDLARFPLDFQHTLRAATVAWLGQKRLIRGDHPDVGAFLPRYLRKSDAELNLKKRPAAGRPA